MIKKAQIQSRLSIGCLLAGAAFTLPANAQQPVPTPSAPSTAITTPMPIGQYLGDVARIDGLDKARDLERYNRLALDFAKRYGTTQPAYEARIILHLVDHLGRTDFGTLDARRDQIERRWIVGALTSGATADFGVRAGLLVRLGEIEARQPPTDEVSVGAQRGFNIPRWIQIWRDYQAYSTSGASWAGFQPPTDFAPSAPTTMSEPPNMVAAGNRRLAEIQTEAYQYGSPIALKQWLQNAFEAGLMQDDRLNPRDSSGLVAALTSAGYDQANIDRVSSQLSNP